MVIFQQAIEFLSRVEQHRCHAVHFAIALYKMKLLLIPDSMQAQLCKLCNQYGHCSQMYLTNVSAYASKHLIMCIQHMQIYTHYIQYYKDLNVQMKRSKCTNEGMIEYNLVLTALHLSVHHSQSHMEKHTHTHTHTHTHLHIVVATCTIYINYTFKRKDACMQATTLQNGNSIYHKIPL